MKNKNRPIVVFNNNITPTALSKAIPKNFDGTVVVNGIVDNPNLSENASLRLFLGHGSLWVSEGIYTQNEIHVRGDIYCNGSIVAGDYIKVDGSLYSKLGIDSFDVSVSGDLISDGILNVADIAVGGNLEASTITSISLCNIHGEIKLKKGLKFDNY